MASKKGKQTERDLESLTQVYIDTQRRAAPREVAWSRERPDNPPIVEPETSSVESPEGKKRQPRKSGLEIIRHRVEEFGFTHPRDGRWVMFPAVEFEAILALERKAVAQVVLFIMRRTIGIPDMAEGKDADGHLKRVEWTSFSHQQLVDYVMGSPTQVNMGLKIALDRKAISQKENPSSSC